MERFSPPALIAEPMSWGKVGSFICAAVGHWQQVVYSEVGRVHRFPAQMTEAVIRSKQLGLQFLPSDSISRSAISLVTFRVGFPPSPLLSQRFCLTAFIDAVLHSLHLSRMRLSPLVSLLVNGGAMLLIIGAVVFTALGKNGFLVGSVVDLPVLSIVFSIALIMLAAIFIGSLTVRLIPSTLEQPLAIATMGKPSILPRLLAIEFNQGLTDVAPGTALHKPIISHIWHRE